jgi:predicted Zn-dependent protease
MPAQTRALFRIVHPLVTAIFLLLTLSATAFAQGRSLLRDPDIEHGLKELARPLIATAGLNPARIDILVINDDRMNAFVANDRLMVLHSGLIMRMDSAAELQAVIAHEVAHIANGHLARRQANARAASRVSAIGLAVGLAAALAGDARAGSGAALGIASGANNVFLGHTRAEESSADASGLRYMAEVGIDPSAMVTVLNRFRGQEALSASRQDAYVRSHPLTRDRLRNVTARAGGFTPRDYDPAVADYWFNRTKGKLSAFLRNPSWTLRRVKASDTSDVGLMRRAVALHRKPDPKAANRAIEALAAKRPKDPYVAELQGQIYLEGGSVSKAVNAYGRAASLAPSNGLILAGYGRALLAANHRDALKVLRRARDRDPGNARLLRDLARSFAAAGDGGNASLATAERYVLLGRMNDAGIHAGRAVGLLPRGSPGWRRADEIVAASRRSGEDR